MTKPIVQSVTFKASPEELFAIFTDSKKHSAATGGKGSVSAKAGAKFTAWDGMLLREEPAGRSRPDDRTDLARFSLEGLRPRLDPDPELFQGSKRRQSRFGTCGSSAA